MTANIIYFTASDIPTTQELADIDAWNAFAGAYSVTVANGAKAPGLGLDSEGDPFLSNASFVAGTVPAIYSEIPVATIADLSGITLDPNQAIITDGDALEFDGATYTFAVEDNVVTSIAVEN
jgi:hypothetical protein